ncbi:hypothetical protein BX666DRAFT_2006646 [Dichotomocladium elegans]|nr:hypothetical protein BX666DRAFT_2006646 [Dichotomocladium elegans]
MQYGYMSAAAAAQWQSASWERERTSLQLASSLHHRKNSFMSSGGIMKSSYSAVSIHPHSPKLIPKTSPSDHQKLVQGNDSNSLAEAAISNRLRSDIFSSSYTFGTHSHDGSMEDSMPDIVIEIDHQTWSCQSPIDLRLKATTRSRDGSLEQPMQQKMIDKFAQLCVRCYRQRRQDGHHRYFITLHHTPHFQQYITNELLQDADALEGTYDVIEVAIEVQPRKQQQQAAHNGFALFVNGNEWPFRLWESRSWSKSGFARNTSGRRNGGMMDGFDSDSELEDSDSEATASSESDSHSDVENGVFSNDMDAGPLGHLEMTGTANKSENTPTSPVTIETLNCNPS